MKQFWVQTNKCAFPLVYPSSFPVCFVNYNYPDISLDAVSTLFTSQIFIAEPKPTDLGGKSPNPSCSAEKGIKKLPEMSG